MIHLCKRRNNNGAMIAIYCSMPWLFLSKSSARPGQPWTLGAVIALCLVLAFALAAYFVCSKRRTAA